MYAVFQTGGKQYRVTPGSKLRVEKLDAKEGGSIEFDRVLAVGEGAEVQIGTPYVHGCKVKATVQGHGKADKIEVIKFKRRKNYHRTLGHRQLYTEVIITDISTSAATATAEKAAPAGKAPAKKAAAKKAPAKKAAAKKATTKKKTTKKKTTKKKTTAKKTVKKS